MHADIPPIDVTWLNEPDPTMPLGLIGLGEVGKTGAAAAIANAVFHATGKRIRDLAHHPRQARSLVYGHEQARGSSMGSSPCIRRRRRRKLTLSGWWWHPRSKNMSRGRQPVEVVEGQSVRHAVLTK